MTISGQQPPGLGNTGGLIDLPGQTGQTGESPVGNSDDMAQNGNMNTLDVAIWLSLFALLILTILVLTRKNRSKLRHKSQ